MSRPIHRASRVRRLLLTSALALSFLGLPPSQAEAAKLKWTVKGTVYVQHQLSELIRRRTEAPLVGIEVRVSARTKVAGKWALWNSWGTTRTNASGAYSISKEKNTADRQFKVEVRFDDERFAIHDGGVDFGLSKPKWYKIYQTITHKRPGVSDIGRMTFNPSGKHDRSNPDAMAHGDFWIVAGMAWDHLKSYGSSYGFTKKLKLVYPANSVVPDKWGEASHVDPATNTVYIFRSKDKRRDHFNIPTIWHEMGHAWAFQHSNGEINLALALLADGDTHDHQEKPFVAFHEGFAEWFAEELQFFHFHGYYEDLDGNGTHESDEFLRSRLKPFTRSYMRDGLKLLNLGMVEKSEHGWMSYFRLLTLKYLHSYDLNGTGAFATKGRAANYAQKTCTQVKNLVFKDVLRVFLAAKNKGYPKPLLKRQMTMEAFTTRAAAILPNFGLNKVSDLLDLMRPQSTVQPWDQLCK